MKKLLQTGLVAVLTMFAFILPAFAQTNAQVEKELVAALADIQKYGNYGDGYDEDKLPKAQDEFREKLLKYTKTASTLSYKFAALDEEMYIATSDDGKFRVYSWDLANGGTMHNYTRLYQYLGADGKVYSQTDAPAEEGDYGSFVTDIFTLDTQGGKIYILCSTFIGSTKDRFQAASLYKIDGQTLNDDVKLIKTKSGLTNSLSFGYDLFSVMDSKERTGELFAFDKKTKTLKIPVVIEDEKYPSGRVTKKSITYRFNGTYFVKIG